MTTDHLPIGKRALAFRILRAAFARFTVTFLLMLLHLSVLHAVEPPNVVLILADDQAYRDFGFMGNELVHTPNLDRLAARSARYSNGYVPMSVCRPSLATMLTGLYPHQHGIHFNHPPPGLNAMRNMSADEYRNARATTDYLIEQVSTLPRILASHGYACFQSGKHWEGSFATAGFTHGMTLGLPTDRDSPITGTRPQTNGELVAHGNGDAGLVIGRETMQPIADFIEQIRTGRTGPLARLPLTVRQQPWFVWYAPFLPHAPFDAGQRFHDLYRDAHVPAHLLPYYAEIARFDETVGRLIDILQQHDSYDNTLIIFLSDNGFRPDEMSPERQNTRSKLSQFEDGLRTPILISWPGVTVPADHVQLVHSIDLVPTILGAVGLSDEQTPRMQGIDLMPSARGLQQLPARAVFGAIYPNDADDLERPSQHVRGRWIRDAEFKLVTPGAAKPWLPPSLYNLHIDPNEQVNLINDAQYRDIVVQMRTQLDAWWPADDDTQVTRKVLAGDLHE